MQEEPKKSSDNTNWYDKYRKTNATGASQYHTGRLELVVWEFEEDGEQLGWGGCIKEESAELKQKFENEFNGDEEKLFEYFDEAFRWTCCGLSGGQSEISCDRHEKGCTCDFCLIGLPLSKEALKPTQHNYGLKLRTCGVTESIDPIKGLLNWQMREIFFGLLGKKTK